MHTYSGNLLPERLLECGDVWALLRGSSDAVSHSRPEALRERCYHLAKQLIRPYHPGRLHFHRGLWTVRIPAAPQLDGDSTQVRCIRARPAEAGQ